MVSKRFIVACAAVAVVTLIGQDDNDHRHSNEKSALVMVCKVIIVTITTDALVGCLLTLISSTTDALAGCLTTLLMDDVRWTKPEFGWVKLNVDGSRDHISHTRSSGCGGVLRDSSGKWLLGFSQKLVPSVELDQTVLEAILKGLELAFNMNIEKLVLEADYDSAVHMVENGLGAKYHRRQFNIISRIRELLSDLNWEVKVVPVGKGANRVANRLANNARALPFEDLEEYLRPPDNCTALVKEDAKVHRV